MKKSIAEAVLSRADGKCEGCRCALGHFDRAPELDHFFGRARAADSEDTIWVLCRTCHHNKTNNKPDAERWFRWFLEHCARNSFRDSYECAFRELQWRTAKTEASKGVA